MNREAFETYIKDVYLIHYDCPWEDELDYHVFRHPDNQKWFALVMDVKKRSIHIQEDGYISIVNLKVSSDVIENLAFAPEPGFFPAYHMNKKHWISIALDGSVSKQTILHYLEMSYNLTKSKGRKKNEL